MRTQAQNCLPHSTKRTKGVMIDNKTFELATKHLNALGIKAERIPDFCEKTFKVIADPGMSLHLIVDDPKSPDIPRSLELSDREVKRLAQREEDSPSELRKQVNPIKNWGYLN